jgi:hypothetical protein
LEEKNQKAGGKQTWKGKSQGPHQIHEPWWPKGKQPDPLPQQISQPKTLPKEPHADRPPHFPQVAPQATDHHPSRQSTVSFDSLCSGPQPKTRLN